MPLTVAIESMAPTVPPPPQMRRPPLRCPLSLLSGATPTRRQSGVDPAYPLRQEPTRVAATTGPILGWCAARWPWCAWRDPRPPSRAPADPAQQSARPARPDAPPTPARRGGVVARRLRSAVWISTSCRRRVSNDAIPGWWHRVAARIGCIRSPEGQHLRIQRIGLGQLAVERQVAHLQGVDHRHGGRPPACCDGQALIAARRLQHHPLAGWSCSLPTRAATPAASLQALDPAPACPGHIQPVLGHVNADPHRWDAHVGSFCSGAGPAPPLLA